MNNIFKQLHLYTLSIEAMNTILIDQMSTYVVLRKNVHFMGHQNFQQLIT